MDKSVKFYSREGAADPFVYVGSLGMDHGDVKYEDHARNAWGLTNCEVLAVVGNYAYTFNV